MATTSGKGTVKKLDTVNEIVAYIYKQLECQEEQTKWIIETM